MRTVIKNGIIVDANNKSIKKDILIENGIIKEIKENLDETDSQIVDAGDFLIIPGLVDMNCNICEPGFEYNENIITASMAAAKGGFTSITCEPNTNPAIDNKSIIEYIISRSKIDSSVNIYPYGSLTLNCNGETISEIGSMVFAGAIGVSDGGNPINNSKLLKNIFTYVKMFRIPIIVHCQDKNLALDGMVNEGLMSTILGVNGIPRESEDIAVAQNIILAENINTKLHISNVSTKGSVQLIREAKQRGVNITADTSPHYFTLTEKECDGYNTFAKVNPPLRTEDDIKEIINGLKDGTIDVISSGHTPVTIESKNMEFANAEFGMSSLETAFPISYTALVENNLISLSELIKKMSYNPSTILQLNKGKIEIGYEADIVIVDTKTTYKIDSSLFMSKAKFTPFQGKEIKGKVIHTFVKGKQIF